MNAIFSGARTTIDGGWRLTFDVDSSQASQVIEVAELRDKGIYLVVVDSTKIERTL